MAIINHRIADGLRKISKLQIRGRKIAQVLSGYLPMDRTGALKFT